MKKFLFIAVAGAIAMVTNAHADDEERRLRCLPYYELLQYLDENNMKLVMIGMREPGDVLAGKGEAVQFWQDFDGNWLVSTLSDRRSCIVGGGRLSHINVGRPAKPLLQWLEARQEEQKKLEPEGKNYIDELLRKTK